MAAQQVKDISEFIEREDCEVSSSSARECGLLVIGPRPKLLMSLKAPLNNNIREDRFGHGIPSVKRGNQGISENHDTEDEAETHDRRPPALCCESPIERGVAKPATYGFNQKPKLKLRTKVRDTQPATQNTKALEIDCPNNQDMKDLPSPSTSTDNTPNTNEDPMELSSEEQFISAQLGQNMRSNQDIPSPLQDGSTGLTGHQPSLKHKSPLLKSVLEKNLDAPMKMSMASYKLLEGKAPVGTSSQSILVASNKRKTVFQSREAVQNRSPSPKKVSFSPNTVYFIYHK